MPDTTDTIELFKSFDACLIDMKGKGYDEESAKKICGKICATDKGLETGQIQTEPIEKPLSEIEKINKIKKYMEKFGYSLNDDELNLMDSLKIKKLEKQIDDFLELQTIKPKKGTQKILALPYGKYYVTTSGYTGWLEFNNKLFDEIITNFENPVFSKPFIDKNHEYKGSYGSIAGFEKSKEGLIANIELNDAGIELVKGTSSEGQYCYHSPSFGKMIDTQGIEHQKVLVTLSLTNIPSLMGAIPPLAEQMKLSKNIKGDNMELRNFLTGMLKLQGEAADPAIIEALTALMTQVQDLQKSLQETMDKLGIVSEQKAVAEEAAAQMNKKMKAIELETTKKECDEFINLAIKEGRLDANEKIVELMKNKFMGGDKQFVIDFVSLQKKQDENTQLITGQLSEMTKLSKEDKFVMEDRGLDPNKKEDVKKYQSWNKDKE